MTTLNILFLLTTLVHADEQKENYVPYTSAQIHEMGLERLRIEIDQTKSLVDSLQNELKSSTQEVRKEGTFYVITNGMKKLSGIIMGTAVVTGVISSVVNYGLSATPWEQSMDRQRFQEVWNKNYQELGKTMGITNENVETVVAETQRLTEKEFGVMSEAKFEEAMKADPKFKVHRATLKLTEIAQSTLLVSAPIFGLLYVIDRGGYQDLKVTAEEKHKIASNLQILSGQLNMMQTCASEIEKAQAAEEARIAEELARLEEAQKAAEKEGKSEE